MQITRVKVKGNKVHIEWNIKRDTGDTDEYTLECIDAPAPSFKEAWDALRQVVVEEAELPGDMVSAITPIGLSVSYYDDGRWGAVVSGTRQLMHSNAPMVINTPHKPAESSEHNPQDDNILIEESVVAIELVLEEAEKYVNGERAQQGLFEEEKVPQEVRA